MIQPIVQFTNSLSKKKEIFKPLTPGKVAMYVCGVTPYDHAHLGHARCYVSFDTLVRLFKFLGFAVTYVRNYTDIDDKIINKAIAAAEQPDAIANRFIQSYQEDMAALNCTVPDIEPRVTTHIDAIIACIEKLIQAKHAYVLDNDVYYDIKTAHNYGKLSGKNIDDLIAGSRVAVNTTKRNPGDFALWKGSSESIYWKSPWGYGRPGWHIECSAMAKKHLGDTIDLHAGGMDLMFPHHENEIAQSEGITGKPFAHLWLHNAFININKEKMSKSLGNAVNLKELFKTIDPMVLRFYFLQHHYRTPLDFEISEFEGIKTAYKKLCSLKEQIEASGEQAKVTEKLESPIINEIIASLCDDLNTSKALGIIFENLSVIKQNTQLCRAIMHILEDIFGLRLQSVETEQVITAEIAALLQERDDARKNRDWTKADALRTKLNELGYKVQDKKN